MANNNTKARLKILHKARKGKAPAALAFDIPKKVPGNRGSGYTTRTQVLTVSSKPAPRRTRKPKVANSAAAFSR